MKRNFFRKCTAILCSAIMMGSIVSYVPSYAENANLISNSTFDSNTIGWNAHCQDGGVGSIGYDSSRHADGVFNISDVVAMQKWLLAVPDIKLADWKAGDLCEDNRLDVFDLCLMKRLLIEQK